MNEGVDIVCQHNVNTHKWNSEDLQRDAELLGITFQSNYLFSTASFWHTMLTVFSSH